MVVFRTFFAKVRYLPYFHEKCAKNNHFFKQNQANFKLISSSTNFFLIYGDSTIGFFFKNDVHPAILLDVKLYATFLYHQYTAKLRVRNAIAELRFLSLPDMYLSTHLRAKFIKNCLTSTFSLYREKYRSSQRTSLSIERKSTSKTVLNKFSS